MKIMAHQLAGEAGLGAACAAAAAALVPLPQEVLPQQRRMQQCLRAEIRI